jgi:hypothetical protein
VTINGDRETKRDGPLDILHALGDLIPRLDNLASYAEAQLQQSTELMAILRGKVNDQLWAGTIQLTGVTGAWSYSFDFAVDFASVGWADTQGNGPFTISTDATGATKGPGTVNTFSAGGDSGTVPLIGKHLTISSSSSSSTPPTLFVAIFTERSGARIHR